MFIMFRQVTTANYYITASVNQSRWFIFWLISALKTIKKFLINKRYQETWAVEFISEVTAAWKHYIFPCHLPIRSFARDLNPKRPPNLHCLIYSSFEAPSFTKEWYLSSGRIFCAACVLQSVFIITLQLMMSLWGLDKTLKFRDKLSFIFTHYVKL